VRRSLLLGFAIGVALADSSVVTLALPDILAHFDLEITEVAWVLISYNLVLAAGAVPAAHFARRRPAPVFAAGAVVFAVASLACGLADSFGVLIAARCVQAAGGALVVGAALDLLTESTGSAARGARVWAVAGIVGAALGPAVGGILTAAVGWEWIFYVQAPLVLVPILAVRGFAWVPLRAPAGRPHIGSNVALLFLSGGLVGALFLLVVLLVDGWRMSPAAAGLVVTVMPVAAIVAGRFASRAGGIVVRAAAGIVLVSGGLCALALLPHAGWGWTVPPQILVGAGIGLTLAALTERALHGRPEQAVHGGWTIASRHAGVVLGLLLISPLLASALVANEDDAERAGAAAVLDSRIPPLDKPSMAKDVLVEANRAVGRVPDVAAAFESRPDTPEYRALLTALEDQLDRAVTHAFSGPFLVSALLALAALVPLGLGRREQGL
jgi:predicted MFS family arabinose efflux permease